MRKDSKTYVKLFRVNRRSVRQTRDLIRIAILLIAMFGLMGTCQVLICKIENSEISAIDCLKPKHFRKKK